MKKVEHDLPRFRVVAYVRRGWARCAAAVIPAGGGTPAQPRVNRGFPRCGSLRYLAIRGYLTIAPIFGACSYWYFAGPKFFVTAFCQEPSLTIFSSAVLIFFSSAASPFLTPMP